MRTTKTWTTNKLAQNSSASSEFSVSSVTKPGAFLWGVWMFMCFIVNWIPIHKPHHGPMSEKSQFKPILYNANNIILMIIWTLPDSWWLNLVVYTVPVCKIVNTFILTRLFKELFSVLFPILHCPNTAVALLLVKGCFFWRWGRKVLFSPFDPWTQSHLGPVKERAPDSKN